VADEKTIIDIEFNVNPDKVVKDIKTVRDAVSSVSKQQTTGEKQSTAAQKQAARIAGKTRVDSAKDRKVEVAQQKWWQFKKPKLMQQELKAQQQITKLHQTQAKAVQQQAKAVQQQQRYYRKKPPFQAWHAGPGMPGQAWHAGPGMPPQGGAQGGGWWSRFRNRNNNNNPPNTPPNGPGGGGGGGGGGGSSIGGYALGGAVAIGAAVVGVFANQLTKAISSYEQQAKASARLEGMGPLGGVNSPGQRLRSERMGYSLTESYGHAAVVGRQTGQVGATATAQEFSRIYGGSVEEVGGVMGGLTRGGQKFDATGGGAGRRQMAHMFRDAVSSGLDRSRTGEHLEAVSAIAEGVGSRTARDVDFSSISGLLGMMGSSGKSGLQGARGASVMSSMDEGIRSRGDDSGLALLLAAAGHGQGGTNDKTYYEAQKRLDEGIFGEGGAELLANIFRTFETHTGGGEEMFESIKLSPVGQSLTRSQIEDAYAAFQSGGAAGIAQFQARGPNIDGRIAEAASSTNLKVNRHEAGLDNRSAAQGEKLYDSVMMLQTLVNDIVDRAMPQVISGLNVAAEAINTAAGALGLTRESRSATQKSYLSLEREEVDSKSIGMYMKAASSATSDEVAIFNYSKALEKAREEMAQASANPLTLATDEHRETYARIQEQNRIAAQAASEAIDRIDPGAEIRNQNNITTLSDNERSAEIANVARIRRERAMDAVSGTTTILNVQTPPPPPQTGTQPQAIRANAGPPVVTQTINPR